MVEGCLPSLGTPALCPAPVALLPALLPARWGLLGLCCIVCSPGGLPSSRVLTPLCEVPVPWQIRLLTFGLASGAAVPQHWPLERRRSHQHRISEPLGSLELVPGHAPGSCQPAFPSSLPFSILPFPV